VSERERRRKERVVGWDGRVGVILMLDGEMGNFSRNLRQPADQICWKDVSLLLPLISSSRQGNINRKTFALLWLVVGYVSAGQEGNNNGPITLDYHQQIKEIVI
jgi:hypothetical protein